MRGLVATTVLLLAILPLHAEDTPKPNTLSPQEAADGWLLLFDGTTTFGWDCTGAVRAVDDALVVGGDQASSAFATTRFGNFELRFQYRSEGDGDKAKLYLQGPTYRTAQGFAPGSGRPADWNDVSLKVDLDPATGDLHGGFQFRFAAGGKVAKTVTIEGARTAPALGFEVSPHGRLAVRNVRLRPLGLQPIFNGKDLTGWKKYEGTRARARSQFTVTPEGWLHIQNGPGDLQTEGQWADFVLQLDCLSNGKHLNSGVFFRCRPGEYQQGYEAQIHNGFRPEAPREYTLEMYDPQTHTLKEKKKVKYAALDYGTGAIYRRQPARFQVARDHEWFTMTVVAEGRHLAVWVNGILVTDWTDHRPRADNARNGCRLEKGPISLQGHDPTTDLSFRNLRLAELPAAVRKK